MSTPANMRTSTLAAPKRSETGPKLQEIELVSEGTPDVSKTVPGKTVADRLRREEGPQFIFPINV